jgi:hypothetical protein
MRESTFSKKRRREQADDFILTRCVSEGLLLKARLLLSLTDVSGCENPLNEQSVSFVLEMTTKAKSNPRKRGSQSCFSLEVGKVRFHMPEKIRGVNAFGD